MRPKLKHIRRIGLPTPWGAHLRRTAREGAVPPAPSSPQRGTNKPAKGNAMGAQSPIIPKP